MHIQFGKLLQSDGYPLVVDRSTVEVALRHGAMAVKFTEALLDIVHAAIHEEKAEKETEEQENQHESTDEEERQER